jgi:hypothetical protein
MTTFTMPADLYAGTQTEAQFQAAVIEAAEYYGWELVLRVSDQLYRLVGDELRGGRRRPPILQQLAGWPDLVLGHRGQARTMYAECKTNKGALKPTQRERLQQLADCGMEVYVWRPRYWHDVERLLCGDTTDPVSCAVPRSVSGLAKWGAL